MQPSFRDAQFSEVLRHAEYVWWPWAQIVGDTRT